MKKHIYSLIFVLIVLNIFKSSAFDEKWTNDDILRKSKLSEADSFYNKSSYPFPFSELSNSPTNPAVSTGYYFIDSDDEASPIVWDSEYLIDTLKNPTSWQRILSGARQKPASYWTNNSEGLPFFRNPAYPLPNGDFFNGPTDSTDDAIAGPIPIGFNFYFNGLKYDSFYVSTNGIIALTNDRYFYNSATPKSRIVPSGATTSYNPMSMDWFTSRTRSGDGLSDPLDDNFGYNSILGFDPLNPTAGIRARGGALDQHSFIINKCALIAPFFGDLHLSQYNEKTRKAEDWGKVYYYRSDSNNKLVIYFINIAPIREINTQYGTYNAVANLRLNETNYISSSAQVKLNNADSSVTITYERLEGTPIVGGRGVPASTIFRYNTTCGVSGFARHVNFGQPEGVKYPWATDGEYPQTTHYFMKYQSPKEAFPHNYLAIKFKQWRNLLRAVDISYRVRKQENNADMKYSEIVPGSKADNYELLAGEDRIGPIQPVGIIQNLSNNIQGPQGVNYQPQQLNFKARFKIINEASGRIVYSRTISIDSTCLALSESNSYSCTGDSSVKVRYSRVNFGNGNYSASQLDFPGDSNLNGIPPYGFVQVFFPPFEPNEYVNNHIGRLKASLMVETIDPGRNISLNDQWGFDDTLSVRLFVLKRLEDFNDDVTSYHKVNRASIPSTLKWVNIDAEVTDGDNVSDHPLPPRGEFAPTNNFDFTFKEPDYTHDTRESPVIKMNRKTLDNGEPANSPGGDQLRSFPIDLRGRYGSILSLSVQRAIKRWDWPRGFSDQELVGPEPRTVVNGDVFNVWNQYAGAASSEPDELCVEFAQPSPDGIKNITNIEESKWRIHPRRKGASPISNMAAYTLFGAGGYMTGFLETDPDSALSQPVYGVYGGLRPDLYDDGFDNEFKKVFIAIPDTVVKSKNEGAKNFRFRLNVQARNNKKCFTCIPDDDDPFIVDNVKLLFPSCITDIEMSAVKIEWPYTVVPASQAIKIPVRIKISNNTNVAAPPFLMRVRIYKKGDNRSIFCKLESLPFLSGNTEITYAFQNWDARKTGPGEYRIFANLLFGSPLNPDQDLEPLNDTTYTDINLKFGDDFAYDPAQSPRSDVGEDAFTGIWGRGLTMSGFATGGQGSIDGPSGGYDENNYGAGYQGGSTSGQIASKFVLYQPDTIYGFKSYWSGWATSCDDISWTIYKGSDMPRTIVPGSLMYKFRLYDDIRQDVLNGEYIIHLYKKPIVLEAGTYWFAIGQMGETGLELGASKSKMGMRTTSISVPKPLGVIGPVGGSGVNLMVDKDFRKRNADNRLVNNNLFAFENIRNSGQWTQFMPTTGNPGFAHLDHFGTTPRDGYTATLTRGTWIPMIRPYFGNRSYSTTIFYDDCYPPVKLTYFNGLVKGNVIELYWETATEINNQGFIIEKKTKDAEEWDRVAFIKGKGDSKEIVRYSHTDLNVKPNQTYSYRLKQIDNDGAVTCDESSMQIDVDFSGLQRTVLEQNTPNPAVNHTTINFGLDEATNVKIDILDLYGNVVKTLLNESKESGIFSIEWFTEDNKNRKVPAGSYLLRMVAGDEVRTVKMTVIR